MKQKLRSPRGPLALHQHVLCPQHFSLFHESFRIRASVQQQVQLSAAHSPREEPVQQREKENKNDGGVLAMSRKIQWHLHKRVKKS